MTLATTQSTSGERNYSLHHSQDEWTSMHFCSHKQNAHQSFSSMPRPTCCSRHINYQIILFVWNVFSFVGFSLALLALRTLRAYCGNKFNAAGGHCCLCVRLACMVKGQLSALPIWNMLSAKLWISRHGCMFMRFQFVREWMGEFYNVSLIGLGRFRRVTLSICRQSF